MLANVLQNIKCVTKHGICHLINYKTCHKTCYKTYNMFKTQRCGSSVPCLLDTVTSVDRPSSLLRATYAAVSGRLPFYSRCPALIDCSPSSTRFSIFFASCFLLLTFLETISDKVYLFYRFYYYGSI
jgi:hypothetical protein